MTSLKTTGDTARLANEGTENWRQRISSSRPQQPLLYDFRERALTTEIVLDWDMMCKTLQSCVKARSQIRICAGHTTVLQVAEELRSQFQQTYAVLTG